MGLPEIIAAGVKAAFSATSTLSTSAVIYRQNDGADSGSVNSTTFDQATGGNVRSHTDYAISDYLLLDYSQREIFDGIAGAGDRKLMLPQASLSVVPGPSGSVFIDGIEHIIVDDGTKTAPPIKADPGKGTWTIRIRIP